MSDDDPFRGAPVAPAALRALVDGSARDARALPRDVERIPDRERRAARALGVVPSAPSGPMALAAVLLFSIGVIALSPRLVLVALGAGMVSAFRALMSSSGKPFALLVEGHTRFPFPVEGFASWLAAEVPLFDVYLRGEVDQPLVVDATRVVDKDTTIEWLGERVFRVAIPPRIAGETRYGDPEAWRRFAEKILTPLHVDVGIARVDMGGSMRALPP